MGDFSPEWMQSIDSRPPIALIFKPRAKATRLIASPQRRRLGVLAPIGNLTIVLRLRAVALRQVKGWPTSMWQAYLLMTALVGAISVLDPATGHRSEGMISALALHRVGMP